MPAPNVDRNDAIAELRRAREYAREKVWGDGRIRDVERANVRVKYLKVIIQAANAERRLMRDAQLDELDEQVEQLRELATGASARPLRPDDVVGAETNGDENR